MNNIAHITYGPNCNDKVIRKLWIFLPCCIPEPTVTKFGMGDEVGDPYLSAKFHYDPIKVFLPAFTPPPLAELRRDGAGRKFWQIFARGGAHSNSASLLVLPSAYSQDPCIDFYDQYVKWRRFVQGCVFLGLPKTKFYISTTFSPRNTNFWPIFDGTKISRQKGLNNGDAHL